MSIFNH